MLPVQMAFHGTDRRKTGIGLAAAPDFRISRARVAYLGPRGWTSIVTIFLDSVGGVAPLPEISLGRMAWFSPSRFGEEGARFRSLGHGQA
jgi:hypothetical protein